MKLTNILFLSALLLLAHFSFAQSAANDIVGKWAGENNKARFEIVKTGDTYSAKIISLAEPNDDAGKPKTDKNNPDKNLRNRPVVGLAFLTGLTFSGKKWENGKVYSLERGETLPCSIELADKNTLKMKASKGIISRTQTWKRL
ncbi:DUF2147 domain-containing protein [Spirosoma linguale]|uniref:DUF2147 domain-containing protein n=1 Tax=Spirosoma linguale (strain ATCC 33905 / DSM 74 / LMG 10896 / Claus 1) TaxID=504472 RepID=D2QBY8_SPILD|nr:Protein of unknown function DUF2147 [Spirosoma linguale DSM 74]